MEITVYLAQEIDLLLEEALEAISSLPAPIKQQYEVTAAAIRLQLELRRGAESGNMRSSGDDMFLPILAIN